MFAQMSAFFNNILSNQQCSFQTGYSTQYCLMVETWKMSADKGKVFGALLTDLSKAFNSLDHKLLTANLNTYSFRFPRLLLIKNYLSNRKLKTKMENT